jgi:hypothetical protein
MLWHQKNTGILFFNMLNWDTEKIFLKLCKKIVWFLLGNSPASEFYMPTFRSTLSAYKNHTQGNHPEEIIQHSEHGKFWNKKCKKLFFLHVSR